MGDVRFTCPSCGQTLEAPPDMCGEMVDCPKCEISIEVPRRLKLTNPQVEVSAKTDRLEVQRTRKCPFCSELILSDAIKCRFCGEFLDGRAALPSTQPPNHHQKVVVKEKGEGCFLQTMNAGCFIVFIIIGLIVLAAVFH